MHGQVLRGDMKHLCSLAAAALLAACITQNDNPPPSDDLDPVDMATIADAARAIYDDVGTDQLRDDLIQVFAALGVPELSASDPVAVAAARGRGAIYALDV